MRRSAVVEVEISAESNVPVSRPRQQSSYLRNFKSLHTKDQAVVAQACFFASSFSAVSTDRGVARESRIHKIKTTKISSEESARFSAKICTSEISRYTVPTGDTPVICNVILLLTYLVHTVKKLQKDGRPFIGACWVTKPLLKLVSKRQPLLLNKYLKRYMNHRKPV